MEGKYANQNKNEKINKYVILGQLTEKHFNKNVYFFDFLIWFLSENQRVGSRSRPAQVITAGLEVIFRE